jgi:demethylmenaquinone methyltransferase/2-methoxy-6-polyprenyl-1,4-benzoquinol methylase
MPQQPDQGTPTAERVRGIFSGIAGRYDLFNRLSSLGVDRGWRRAAVDAATLGPSSRALDICAGTGDLTLEIARRARPAEVIGSDFVPEMLALAEPKVAAFDGPTTITLQVADAQALPFADSEFDAVTVAFGVRNLPDRAANFAEVLRVLRPGGRYVILDFSRPTSGPVRTVYHVYLRHVIPALGALLTRDRASFAYLNDSIRAFPDQSALARELEAAGFSAVTWRDLTFGIVALHVAVK